MSNVEGTMFEQLARNTTSNDIPTLIEVLQSPVLLQPVANQFDLSTDALIGRIAISTGGVKRKEAKGVLNVRLTGRNPVEDERLLKALSNTYLQAALQRQRRYPTAWISSTSRLRRCRPISINFKGNWPTSAPVIPCWSRPQRRRSRNAKPPWPPRCLAWKPNATA